MKDTIVAFGKQVYYNVGTIEPGATVDIEKTLDRALASYLQEKRRSFIPANYWNQAENVDRADLIREMMFHDSDASGQETVPSRTHHELDLTGQLAARPADAGRRRSTGPGPSSSSATPPARPGPTRTTVLRVILPLKKEAAAVEAEVSRAARRSTMIVRSEFLRSITSRGTRR